MRTSATARLVIGDMSIVLSQGSKMVRAHKILLMQRLIRVCCRNVYRGTPEMYSLDSECLALAKGLIVSLSAGLTRSAAAASCTDTAQSAS